MVHNGGNMGKEPLVRAVSDPVNVLARRPRQLGPSLGDDGPDTRCTDSVEDGPNDTFRIVKHNAAETNVHRWRAG